MTHMMSHPGQRPLVESLWQLPCQPIAAIPRWLEGNNQGPVGLDYRYTSGSSAQRSGFLFHHYTLPYADAECPVGTLLKLEYKIQVIQKYQQ